MANPNNLRGWKTYLGGGLVLISGIFCGLTKLVDPAQALTMIGLGLGIIGIGSKIEKANGTA